MDTRLNESGEGGSTLPESTFCHYFNRRECRSCSHIQQDYLSQIRKKEEAIRTALGFLMTDPLEPSIHSPLQEFRNRAKMTVTGSVENPVVGLLGEDNLDQGREILYCPIHAAKLNQIIASIPEFIRSYNLIPYNIEERKGELKGLIVFYSPVTHQAYLRFILRSKECVARIRKLLPVLQSKLPEILCVTANIQPIPHAIQEGPEEVYLTERKNIDLQVGPICLKLSPQAFVQTNITVATELYQTGARWIQEAQPKKVLELFCGQGAFSLVAAHSATVVEEFLGIELNPDAVQSANQTAKVLDLRHVKFQASDAIRAELDMRAFRPDLVLVNPPRRGLTQGASILKAVLPRHVIYSSCSIKSLSSDLQVLSESYRIKRVQLFDMFPHTAHFETLVWLERF